MAHRRPGRAWILLALLWACPLDAHELGSLSVKIFIAGDRAYRVEVGVDAEHLPGTLNPYAGLADEAPDALRQARVEAFVERFMEGLRWEADGHAQRPSAALEPLPKNVARPRIAFGFEGHLPQGTKRLQWAQALPVGQYLVSFQIEGQPEPLFQWAEGGRASEPFDLVAVLPPPTRARLVLTYLKLGYTHILPQGLDHILFVLGIFFLSLRARPILLQVTAFTLAHSLTLGLSLFGVMALSPRIVEPLIALSIVVVAAENVLTETFRPWRIAIVFGFGLLHGLGFAGTLHDMNLPSNEIVPALVFFNLGVEGGQLTVIALAFVALGVGFGKRPWYRSRIAVPASLAIGAAGLFWTIQRIVLS